jgi:hypothetical protein
MTGSEDRIHFLDADKSLLGARERVMRDRPPYRGLSFSREGLLPDRRWWYVRIARCEIRVHGQMWPARLNQIFKSILIKFLGIIRGRKDKVGWEANES